MERRWQHRLGGTARIWPVCPLGKTVEADMVGLAGSQPAKGVASSIIRPLLLIGATAVMPQPDAHFACGVSIGGLGISSGTDAADRRSDT